MGHSKELIDKMYAFLQWVKKLKHIDLYQDNGRYHIRYDAGSGDVTVTLSDNDMQAIYALMDNGKIVVDKQVGTYIHYRINC